MGEGDSQRLKIEAHDASRVEWSMYVPLPQGREGNDAAVDLWLEFPENVYVPHDGWNELQILARLSSPDEDVVPADPRDFDGLRRAALAAARRIKILRESIPRAGRLHALHPMPVAPSLARDLERILELARAALRTARAGILAPRPGDPEELNRERRLADEFLSGQVLELLTQAEETARRLARATDLGGTRAVALRLEARVKEDLAAELLLREQRGELLPDGDDPEALALFVDRGAQLKKHFQEVLFLEPETRMVDDQIRNWVGVAGAATAFVIYFGLQTLQNSAAASAGLGLGTLLTVGAVAYALKDRMKEITRQWLTGKLSHYYANRVLLLREPARFERGRNVVLAARESLLQEKLTRPDPLNPAAGAIQRMVLVHYRMRARVHRLRGSPPGVFARLKLVFRYDLAPILSRLDDSVKRVPVPVAGKEQVRFADAPRLYRLPLRLWVKTPAGLERRAVAVILQRQGIARIVEAEDLPPGMPALELPDADEDPAVAVLRREGSI